MQEPRLTDSAHFFLNKVCLIVAYLAFCLQPPREKEHSFRFTLKLTLC